MQPVIKIENLYKEYRLGAIGYGTLREDLVSWWAKFRGRSDPNSIINQQNNNTNLNHILALNKINLEVNKGERLGIIGKNGAGKTTLLKILSRISSPTQGSIKINGRLASLIAIGTGFHPELSGRENIYLNGSILGLRKHEIDERLDEIIDFSGVEKYIDTPVKRYSSGMHVRLGFAVAAHLNPDILIVDEVLAVGDAEFRKKAIEKMKPDGRNENRTVIFVSHNMSAVDSLCSRAILLDSGKIIDDGIPKTIINNYLYGNQKSPLKSIWNKHVEERNTFVDLEHVKLIDQNNKQIVQVKKSDKLGVEIKFKLKIPNKVIIPALCIYNNLEEFLFRTYDGSVSFNNYLKTGSYISTVWLPLQILSKGEFSITVLFFSPAPVNSERLLQKNNILKFKVNESKSSRAPIGMINDNGLSGIEPELKWHFSKF